MNDSVLTIMVVSNIAGTALMGYVFFRILTSKNRSEGNYPLP